MKNVKVFDFENENYNLAEAIERVKMSPDHALWFVNKLTDYDIARVIARAWDATMETKYEK